MPADDPVTAAVSELVPTYRAKHQGSGELVLVLPRWLWDRYGQEQLTASLQRLGVQHVKVVEDWAEAHEVSPKVLLYEAGTWHTNATQRAGRGDDEPGVGHIDELHEHQPHPGRHAPRTGPEVGDSGWMANLQGEHDQRWQARDIEINGRKRPT